MGIGIEVLPIGPVAVASRLWRHRGRRLFTAIVKASFALQHDAAMTIMPPVPVATEERHYRGNPVASLVRASDLALLVPKPEVVVFGSAYAGPGQSTPQTTVRFAVQRESTVIINKRLEIIGDRRAKPGAAPPDPLPFQKMPILYERARGGIAARYNPVGVGMATEPDGLLTLPNINLPSQGGVNPHGLGPIPSAWPLRQKKRGSLSWTHANSSPDVDVPDDFDDAYYQTAPADQQTTELKPGDLIAIVNMHPELGMLRTYLPMARGVALTQTARGDRQPLNLRIDTVHIEPDQMRAEIVFRGASVIDERDLGDLRLAGAIEQPDAPFVFPDLSTMMGLVARRSTEGSMAPPTFETTAVIDEPVSPAARDAAERALRPSTPPAGPALGRAGTMVMEPEATQPLPGAPHAMRPPSPAGRSDTPPPGSNTAEAEPSDRRVNTMVIETEAAPKSLPFDRSHTKNIPETAPSRDATPWAVAPPDEVELGGLDDSTLDAPPTPSPVPAPAKVVDEPSSREVDSNAETPKRDPTPPPASSVAARPARTSLKHDLYKKLKR